MVEMKLTQYREDTKLDKDEDEVHLLEAIFENKRDDIVFKFSVKGNISAVRAVVARICAGGIGDRIEVQIARSAQKRLD